MNLGIFSTVCHRMSNQIFWSCLRKNVIIVLLKVIRFKYMNINSNTNGYLIPVCFVIIRVCVFSLVFFGVGEIRFININTNFTCNT